MSQAARVQGLDPHDEADTLNRVFAALSDLVTTYGEDAVGKMADKLREPVGQKPVEKAVVRPAPRRSQGPRP